MMGAPSRDGLSQAEPEVSALRASIPSAVHRWEAKCLSDDPFAGDYGGSDSNDGVLSDKMVTNRKGGTCSTCGGPCDPGTRNRVRAEVYDGEFMRFRWCVRCCFGMAVYDIRPSILDQRIASAIEARQGRDSEDWLDPPDESATRQGDAQ